MDYFNFAIIGSGPAGVAAARQLAGHSVCVIDAGEEPQAHFPYKTLRDALAAGDITALLGSNWEMLGNIFEPDKVHAKLRSPAVRYVAGGEAFRVFDERGLPLVRGAGSYAAGGMSNAWGAQLLRYTNRDLAEATDWPIDASELEPYYRDIEKHIGIAGQVDDMHEYLGDTVEMMPPVPIVPAAERLLMRYEAKRATVNAMGLRMGRSRLAILTCEKNGRPKHDLGETEFFSTRQPGLYTAQRTLDELRLSRKITYLGGHELIDFRESVEHVDLDVRVRADNSIRTIRAKHLLIACGPVHTARLVLMKKGPSGVKLPFMDHTPILIPFFLPFAMGSKLPERSFCVQLTATLATTPGHYMISIYYPGGMLLSDLILYIPLPIDASLRLLPMLLGGLLVAQIWETSRPRPGNQISIGADGALRIDYHLRPSHDSLPLLLAAFRKLGVYSTTGLAQISPPGWGFHYAGCLPMRKCPRVFETHIDGRLWDSKRVRVIDASIMPTLPAKNHSLTMMANSARIAAEVLRCER